MSAVKRNILQLEKFLLSDRLGAEAFQLKGAVPWRNLYYNPFVYSQSTF